MSLIATDQLKIIIGLGVTGLSCAKLLARKNVRFMVLDTRKNPANLSQFKQLFPDVKLLLGELDRELLATASEIILSPGIAKDDPAIVYAQQKGAVLIGDIDLFCREVNAPIIAITGSNAKTTVTTLVGEMASRSGLQVGVGGNIGLPVLDFLEQPEKDVYVLELSSFQLETTHELRADVATILNLTPDHLDRYSNDFRQYHLAKHRIFKGCKTVVENLDDLLTHPLVNKNVKVVGYRLGLSDFNVFGLMQVKDADSGEPKEFLALAKEPLMATERIKLPGRHNIVNALAALSIGYLAGFDMQSMLNAVADFSGLEHRCQRVASKAGVDYFNDSKGTNVGATVAALQGLGGTLEVGQGVILIAGGDSKGACFKALRVPVAQYVKTVVLIGSDAQKIASVIENDSSVIFASNMQEAVDKSATLASKGDIVLLSPACASFDMFDNYAHRGDVFSAAVRQL